ncbi:glycosyltransferase family 39 protein [Candidatus Microgenomates bacterium]|nr:glycosyltransferase family 39 protein [Candidatus Microgenomates bacterium]
MKKIIILVFLVLASSLLYGSLLARTPVHLNQDELGFSLNAYSVAKTGFDENGRLLPFYFWHLGVMWATPIIVYLASLFLLFMPISEITIRLPSVMVGIIDVILIYFLTKKLFSSEKWGMIAAILLALTPVHFIQSRLLLDNLYIVPFVLGWLFLMAYYLDKKKIWLLFLAGLVLGIGIHSYHAAKVMMPIYLLMTFIFLLPQIKKQKKLVLILIVGFILPILPIIPWLVQYPDTLIDQVRYTRLYDTNLNPLSGVISLLSPENIIHKIAIFIAYFDPYFLFTRGDVSLIHSTAKSGVFLWPVVIFLPLGIYQAFKERTRINLLLIVGVFTSPIAAALVGDHYRISRALVMLPFAIILATYGIKFLISHKSYLLRAGCHLLLILILIQFAYFWYDYMKDYRIRSYEWFKYNIPGALERVIVENQKKRATAIYLDNRIEFIDRYWRFYTIKNNQTQLMVQTYYFEPADINLESLPANTLILYHFNDVDGQKTQIGPFTKVADIIEPDGTSRFYLYRN